MRGMPLFSRGPKGRQQSDAASAGQQVPSADGSTTDHSSPASAMHPAKCGIAIMEIAAMIDDDTDQTEAAPDEPAWVRNRRIRSAELESANARGAELAARYG